MLDLRFGDAFVTLAGERAKMQWTPTNLRRPVDLGVGLPCVLSSSRGPQLAAQVVAIDLLFFLNVELNLAH